MLDCDNDSLLLIYSALVQVLLSHVCIFPLTNWPLK